MICAQFHKIKLYLIIPKIDHAIFIYLKKNIVNMCLRNIVLHNQKKIENMEIIKIYHQNVY